VDSTELGWWTLDQGTKKQTREREREREISDRRKHSPNRQRSETEETTRERERDQGPEEPQSSRLPPRVALWVPRTQTAFLISVSLCYFCPMFEGAPNGYPGAPLARTCEIETNSLAIWLTYGKLERSLRCLFLHFFDVMRRLKNIVKINNTKGQQPKVRKHKYIVTFTIVFSSSICII
jgi:hypothetical protein